MVTDTVLGRDFAGLHFTGSTHVFKDIGLTFTKHTQNFNFIVQKICCSDSGHVQKVKLSLIIGNQ
jgi:hypothetical protein